MNRAGIGEPAGGRGFEAGGAVAPRVSISRTIGIVVFALIIIPVAIAALQTLAISAIADPAVAVLQTVLHAIPRVLAAAILLIIGWFVGRWVRRSEEHTSELQSLMRLSYAV